MSDSICLPAEWALQSRVMLTWPHGQTDWLANLDEAETVFVEIAFHITEYEDLLIVCQDAIHQTHILNKLQARKANTDRIRFYHLPSNDTWARDHGPITVFKNHKPCVLDFEFNGWGNKHPAEQDNLINRGLHAQGAFGDSAFESIPWVLEGGSLDSDGQGTLLTTEACLLNPNRNPQWDKAELETRLKDMFGLEKILWLKHGFLAGDDTDSHIDMLARFCNPDTIAYLSCDDPGDIHYAELKEMEQELYGFTRLSGERYKLIPLPFPSAKFDPDGERLPASYANFLIINKAVLVPLYDDPVDELALQRLQQAFPDRNMIGIQCLPIIHQSGSLHCLTMQIPEVQIQG